MHVCACVCMCAQSRSSVSSSCWICSSINRTVFRLILNNDRVNVMDSRRRFQGRGAHMPNALSPVRVVTHFESSVTRSRGVCEHLA